MNRRQYLKAGCAFLLGYGVSGGRACFAGELCGITPQEVEGPFYPLNKRQESDIDLTRQNGVKERAQGEIIIVEGVVTGVEQGNSCKPITNALVEIWQANSFGRYQHPRDSRNPAPLDSGFQGWGVMRTDEHGRYRFKTIVPGSYPAGPDWTRPPHIHFKVHAEKHIALTTQMYFAGEALNKKDLLLNRLPADEQSRVVVAFAKDIDAGEAVRRGVFNIVLSANG